MLLLAQLIEAPLQPGPIRLPEQKPLQRSAPETKQAVPAIQDNFQQQAPEASSEQDSQQKPRTQRQAPQVSGNNAYSEAQLKDILANCGRSSETETLKACAAALTARYVADGYVNTRVYVVPRPAPGALEVVEGRIAEIRIDSANPRFVRRVQRLLRPLQGTVLNLPKLDQQLQWLRSWPGIGNVQGSIGRLGSDPTLAVLTLNVDQKAEPVQGEVSLRDDGNAGNGQWRAMGTVLKNDLLTYGDTLLVYGEGDMDDTPELGAVISSITYAYPLSESVRLTGSFGYSRRNLVEGALAPLQWSFRQFQGYGQLEWVFNESLNTRWFAFGGVSINRNDAYAAGRSAPILNGFADSTNNSGFFRFGVGVNGLSDRSSWSISAYGLQGSNAFSLDGQLQNLASLGVIPGQATALGGSASLSYALSPNVTLNLRGAGQIAFNPLIGDMGFSLGSDTGLRGLPGQTISGDSGYLSTAEIAWTFWSKGKQSVQLVPFIGYGGVTSNRYVQGVAGPIVYNNGIGAGGLMARFLAGKHWQVEIGWVGQIDHFDQLDNAIWGNDYLIGKGLYINVKYRF